MAPGFHITSSQSVDYLFLTTATVGTSPGQDNIVHLHSNQTKVKTIRHSTIGVDNTALDLDTVTYPDVAGYTANQCGPVFVDLKM